MEVSPVLAVVPIASDKELRSWLHTLSQQEHQPQSVLFLTRQRDLVASQQHDEITGLNYQCVHTRKAGQPLLALKDRHMQQRTEAMPDVGWYWILDETHVPESSALSHLLHAGEETANVAAVGAKHLLPAAVTTTADTTAANDSRVAHVGYTLGRSGRLIELEDPRHPRPDQGQWDHLADVFAPPAAGLLVRRDELHHLPVSRLLHDNYANALYSRSLWLAGKRVIIEPQAHLSGPKPHQSATQQHLFRLLSASWWAYLPLLLGLVVSSLLTGAGYLLRGRLVRMLESLTGGITLVVSLPVQLLEKVALANAKRVGTSTLKKLRLSSSESWQRARDRYAPVFESADTQALRMRRAKHLAYFGRLQLLAGLVAIGLASWVTAGSGALGARLSTHQNLAGLWADLLSWWQPSGLGLALGPNPQELLYGLLATVSFGRVGWLATAILVCSPIIAAWTVWLWLGQITHSPARKFIFSAVWVLSPVAYLVFAGTDLYLALTWFLLPVLLLAISARRYIAAGFAAAVLLAAQPNLLPLWLVLIVALALLKRPGTLWSLIPVGLLFGPYLYTSTQSLMRPQDLLWALTWVERWQWTPLAAGVAASGVALACLFAFWGHRRTPHSGVYLLMWVGVALTSAGAILLVRLDRDPKSYLLVLTAFAIALLITSRARQRLLLIVGVVCALLPLGSVVLLTQQPEGVRLPALVLAEQESPRQMRALHVHVEQPQSVELELIRPQDSQWLRTRVGEMIAPQMLSQASGVADFMTDIAGLYAADEDAVSRLNAGGISWIILTPADSPDVQQMLRTPGVTLAVQREDITVLQVLSPDREDMNTVAAVQSFDAKAEFIEVLTNGARMSQVADTITLAERFAPGWQASVAGHDLTPTQVGWQQAFQAGPGTGEFEVTYRHGGELVWYISSGIGLLVLAGAGGLRRVKRA